MSHEDQRPPDRKSGGLFCVFLVSGNCFAFEVLHHLCHNFTHGDRRGVLGLPGGMRVGAEREASVVVTQHGGNGLHIHAILQRCCRECMSELMKFQVWESRVLQNLFVDVYHRVWMVHLAGNGRWEEVGIVGMLVVFRDEQVNGLLRDRTPAGSNFLFSVERGRILRWGFGRTAY